MMGTDLVDILLGLTDKSDNVVSRGLKAAKKDYDYINNIRTNRNIKTLTKNLILHYPFLCSDDLTIQADRLCVRACEADYTQMLLILLNSNFSSKMEDNEDTATFLKRFHTNITPSMSNINEAHMELLEPYQNLLSESILNEYTISDNILNEAFEIILEAKKKYNTNFEPDDKEKEKRNYEAEKEASRRRYETEKRKKEKEERELEKQAQYQKEKEKFDFVARNSPSTSNAKTIVMDLKKLNSIAPIIVTCDVNIADSATQTMLTKKITFGVKGICHLLKSDDIVYYFSDTVKDKSKLFRFIQWTTGEIKLVRDLILSLDSVKKMAIQNKYKDSFWWRKLSSLSKSTKIKKCFSGRNKNTAVATSTFVISKKEVETLKIRYGIDLMNNPASVNKLMDNFFMLGLIVVDEALNIAYIYNTENFLFEQFSFSQLDKYGAELKELKKENPLDALRSLLRG